MTRSTPASPQHRGDAAPNLKSSQPVRATGTSHRESRASTILLVDDDKAVRESLGRVFATEGWRIFVAANGEEALEHLAEQVPDLMITDLCMAGVNGWDLLFHEALQRPSMPVFVISGLGRHSVQGADLLAAEFFPKPLDLEALVGAVHRRLGRDRATPAHR